MRNEKRYICTHSAKCLIDGPIGRNCPHSKPHIQVEPACCQTLCDTGNVVVGCKRLTNLELTLREL